MDLKLGVCIHHSESEFFSLVLTGSSEVIIGSSFVWVYLWYTEVKRNSLCDILKVGEPRQPYDRAVREPPIFITCTWFGERRRHTGMVHQTF